MSGLHRRYYLSVAYGLLRARNPATLAHYRMIVSTDALDLGAHVLTFRNRGYSAIVLSTFHTGYKSTALVKIYIKPDRDYYATLNYTAQH